MIVLIERDNGEQYEDYMCWIEKVYEISENGRQVDLEREWRDDIVTIMEANGITVNPHYLNIMEHSKKKSKKIHTKILKENNFEKWLVDTYDAKLLEFVTCKPHENL